MVDIYFDDIIKVDRLDPDGKKFDKVSRIEAQSEEYDMHLQLDVNTEVYPIRAGEKFRMALAPTLNLDGSAVTTYVVKNDIEFWFKRKLSYLLPTFRTVYMSFGGLQLMLKGDPSYMGKFKLDQRLFLLMRKV
ncbi:hypothetical protein Acr_15g0013230 [Actinidia rufa]|uniref:Uncharacterized protein n=1 Tax=Actinidia rufa TaxID=165716 RepID=A0A7J0FVL1_9ERIC|nr:hypothetical protein Acr_15g0013230 [Actinidia rufa]